MTGFWRLKKGRALLELTEQHSRGLDKERAAHHEMMSKLFNPESKLVLQCFSCSVDKVVYATCTSYLINGEENGVYKADLIDYLLSKIPAYKGHSVTGRSTLTVSQVNKALEALDSGDSVSDVARSLGVSRGTIYRLQRPTAREYHAIKTNSGVYTPESSDF